MEASLLASAGAGLRAERCSGAGSGPHPPTWQSALIKNLPTFLISTELLKSLSKTERGLRVAFSKIDDLGLFAQFQCKGRTAPQAHAAAEACGRGVDEGWMGIGVAADNPSDRRRFKSHRLRLKQRGT